MDIMSAECRGYVLVSLGCHNEIPRTRGLNNRHLFLPILEAGKSKIKVPVDLVSSKSPLPGFQTAAFLLCPQKSRKNSTLFLFLQRH